MGNAGTSPGVNFLGTTDNRELVIRVNNRQALRIRPDDNGVGQGSSVTNGANVNTIFSEARFATIGGGGIFDASQPTNPLKNEIRDDGGTIGGGAGNRAGNLDSTPNNATYATVGGGQFNVAEGIAATVAGGYQHLASGAGSSILGGVQNYAQGLYSTVAGGTLNLASAEGAFIAGGQGNVASGLYSWAGGFGASANDNNSFIWSSSGGSTDRAGQFKVVATGGAQFNVSGSELTVSSTSAFPFVVQSSFVTGTSLSVVPTGAGGLPWSFFATTGAWPGGGGKLVIGITETTNVLTLTSTGRAGLGTNSPEAFLHISDGTAGSVTANSNSSAVLERGTTNYLSILSPDANERGILFGSPADNDHGGIFYTNGAGMNFRTGGNLVRMTLDEAGQVGLGTTAPASELHLLASDNTAEVNLVPTVASNGGHSQIFFAEDPARAFGTMLRYDGTANQLQAIGRASGTDTAVNFSIARDSGNVDVRGSLSKGGGSFKIDHPLDPTNKYLYHSFVESPDMMNVYNGNVTTDAAGFATITLPDWFEALNRDFRYQLTVIDSGDSDFALARVYHKIEGNRFVIKTSLPRIEVSWQVTGIRKDAWAERNRIPVEVTKPVGERGRLLHPEAFAPAAPAAADQ